MKKEIIFVPKDKCQTDLLKEFGELFQNSWIFLHENVCQSWITRLNIECVKHIRQNSTQEILIRWKLSNNSDTTTCFDMPTCDGWGQLTSFNFSNPPQDPENIYFFKLAE